jgi:hypothetical protein
MFRQPEHYPLDPYEQRRNTIMLRVNALHYTTVAEARHAIAAINLAKKELKLLLQDVRSHMKTLRAQGRYNRQMKADVPAFALFMRRGDYKSMRAKNRENMRHKETVDLQPFEAFIRYVDQVLVSYDRLKLDIEQWILAHKTP